MVTTSYSVCLLIFLSLSHFHPPIYQKLNVHQIKDPPLSPLPSPVLPLTPTLNSLLKQKVHPVLNKLQTILPTVNDCFPTMIYYVLRLEIFIVSSKNIV